MTLLLNLEHPQIPESIKEYAKSNNFIEKHEYYLTILSFQNGKRIQQVIASNPSFLRDDILHIAESLAWKIEHLHEYHVLQRTIPEFILHGVIQTPRHTRRSIIEKIVVPDLQVFFQRISDLLKIHLEVPVAHLTLFTWSDYEPEAKNGIALNSSDDFNKYAKMSIPV